MRKKPPRSIFKLNKIADWHWSLQIPIWFKSASRKWDIANDTPVWGHWRRHFCIAVLIHGWPGFKEIRIRVGTQLL